MANSIGQVMQNHPLVNAAKNLIDYSVQLRQHGDKSFRDKIVRFQEQDELSAWKKVKELYDLASPGNKHMQITNIKSCLYPLYSFANTYSQDWYFVLHWRENDPPVVSATEPIVQPIAQPVMQPVMAAPVQHSFDETKDYPF